MGGPTLVIYTEDSSKDADATMRALVERLLYRLEPNVQVHRVELRSALGDARAAAAAQRWKGQDARGEGLRRALANELARRLVMGDFVVFHYDGDKAWDGQPGSPHDGAVAELYREIHGHVEARGKGAGLLAGFLRLVPFYSVESWLYLNRKAVVDLVNAGRPLQEGLDWLDAHLDDDLGYDGVKKPKDACPLGAKCNRTLAEQQWSAATAAASSPSWRQVEADWTSCAGLMTALRQTCPWLPAPEPDGER